MYGGGGHEITRIPCNDRAYEIARLDGFLEFMRSDAGKQTQSSRLGPIMHLVLSNRASQDRTKVAE